MKTLLTPTVVPPEGGWWWVHPETGHQLWGVSFEQLMNNARTYCRANNFPIGVAFEQNIIDTLCERLPEICGSTEPPTLKERASSFLRAAKNWVSGGMQVLSFEDYETRHKTCQECSWWHGEAMFGLGKCGKCGCIGIKLYMTTEKCPLGKWTV